MIYIAVEQKNGKKTSIYFKSFFSSLFLPLQLSQAITMEQNMIILTVRTVLMFKVSPGRAVLLIRAQLLQPWCRNNVIAIINNDQLAFHFYRVLYKEGEIRKINMFFDPIREIGQLC